MCVEFFLFFLFMVHIRWSGRSQSILLHNNASRRHLNLTGLTPYRGDHARRSTSLLFTLYSSVTRNKSMYLNCYSLETRHSH